jgi:F-type H+-transporting ATPase subunit b
MLRRSTPALGLLALLIAIGLLAGPAVAQEPPGHDATHPKPAAAGEAAKPSGEHGPAAEGAAEAGHEPKPMQAEPSLAIWTLFVFLGVLAVLGKFAWGPMIKALHERESHLEQVLLDSEKARNEAEALAAKHRKELSQAADQVRALIEEARKEASAAAASILQKAQEEAEASRHRAEREIAGARDQALMEIWSKTADLAVSVAGKVLGKELGESDHKRLVEVAMNELPARANANGQGATRS